MQNHEVNPERPIKPAENHCGVTIYEQTKQLIGRLGLALSLSLSAGAATTLYEASHIEAAMAMDTGGYPDAEKPCVAPNDPDWGKTSGNGYWCDGYRWGDLVTKNENSGRGYGYRNCTDWASFRETQLTGKTVPSNWGNAKDWDDRAPSSMVDTTPEPGDIAVWNEGDYGHVSIVESVNGDGSVNVSEYNKNQDGNYGTRPSVKAEKYIDLNGTGIGINGESLSGGPVVGSVSNSKVAALKRGDGNMDVFYRDSTAKLINRGWNSILGWSGVSALAASGTVSSNPAAVARSSGNMDVFYRDGSNNLVDIGWDVNNGWGSPVNRAGGASGDFSVVSRSSGNMDAFYQTLNGGIGEASWDVNVGWSGQILVGSGSVGNPVVVSRSSGNMDVFYQDNQGHLVDKGWDVNSGWSIPVLRASGVGNNPVGITRTPGNMDVFYRKTNGGLADNGWDANLGWRESSLGGSVA